MRNNNSRHLIYFASKREHAIPLFTRANIYPVEMLYYKAISTLLHDIHCKTAPTNLIELFTNIDSIHSYNTRSTGNFYEKILKLYQQSQSLSRTGYKIWNILPQNLRKKRRFFFKNCLKQILMRFLEHEDAALLFLQMQEIL